MAENPKPEAAAAKAPAKKSGSKLPLIIVAVVVLIALGAGGWIWHRRSAAAQSQENAQPESPQTGVKSTIHLESFVVNLQGASDSGYLRVGIDLGVGSVAKDGDKDAVPTGRLRDAILTVLATGTVDALLTAAGKEKLKQDLLKSINDQVPEIQCKEIYFTEFLVQH